MWAFQEKAERRRRFKAVSALCIELAKIRSINTFSGLMGEAAIEAVITGEWSSIPEWIDMFEFKGEFEEIDNPKPGSPYRPPPYQLSFEFMGKPERGPQEEFYYRLWENFRTLLKMVGDEASRDNPGGN